MFFVDALNGWLVGDLGLIMHTSDGGVTWAEQSISTTNDLVQVKFIDANRGWVAGTNGGETWRTEDGGRSWIAGATAPVLHPTKLWVVRDHVVVISGHSSLETTPDVSAVSEDGGVTWRRAALVVDQVEGDGTLWNFSGGTHSSDLGATIDTSAMPGLPDDAFVQQVGFDTGGFAWAKLIRWLPDSRSWMRLLATRSGQSRAWVTQALQPPASPTPSEIVDMTLDANGSGWSLTWPAAPNVSDDRTTWRLARTKDGGKSWQWVQSPGADTQPWLASYQFVDGQTAWVDLVGSETVRYLTTDAGLTWVVTTADGTLRRDAAGQLVVHSASHWRRSADQGLTWRDLPSPSPLDFNVIGLWMSPDGPGFAVANDGTVFDTKDLGNHWSARAERVANWVRDLRMQRDGSGWMIADGRLLRTLDGGKNWAVREVSSIGDAELVKLLYADGLSLRAMALANCPETDGINFCSTVLHSSDDGGSTWHQGTGALFSVDGLQVRAVGFATADVAIRVDGYNVDRSIDGGRTWAPVVVPEMRGSANRVVFQDAERGWMIGFDGGARRTTDGGLTWTVANLPLPNGRVDPSNRPWLRDVAFGDADHGWIVGDDGLVLATSDGGSNWTSQASGTPYSLNSALALDAHHAWIAGAKTSILGTVTGGEPAR